jgi:hypothetical protein
MPDNETVTVESTKEVKGKVVLSFTKPSPIAATWAFRIVFLLTTAATIIITAEPNIPNDLKVRIFLYMKAGDFVVWGIARGLGVDKSQFQEDAGK